MNEIHITLSNQQKTLISNDAIADTPRTGGAPSIYATDAGISNTQAVPSSIINTTDDASGSGSAVEGTTADPRAGHLIYVGGVAIGAITNPRLPTHPPNLNDARESPAIEGETNYGIQFPIQGPSLPSIP